jgi:hypothetical protein
VNASKDEQLVIRCLPIHEYAATTKAERENATETA